MFTVKVMSDEDFDFAVRLTDTKDWNLLEDDFRFMKALEPEGCFVLFSDSKRIGLITTISYDTIGWFGDLIVTEEYRRKGAGSTLVKHAVEYLTGKGVQTVGIYAYIATIPFYEKLGFSYDSEFLVLQGNSFHSPAQAEFRKVTIQDLHQIVNFDAVCFGAAREKLLQAILSDKNNACFVHYENAQMVGYAMTKVFEGFAEIGPLGCEKGRSDVAIGLLKAIFNQFENSRLSLYVPEKESSIINFLSSSGIRENFRVARMFLNPFIVKNCPYLAESLERG